MNGNERESMRKWWLEFDEANFALTLVACTWETVDHSCCREPSLGSRTFPLHEFINHCHLLQFIIS